MIKKIIVFLFIIVFAGVAWLWQYKSNLALKKPVDSFEDCQKAGYPVSESYPAQCKTPDGKTYSQDIGNELDRIEEIRIDQPRPNASISSPVTIEGYARGNWFFEASFTVSLTDANGNNLGTAIAKTDSDWMTEDFVPFTAELNFSDSESATGTLILEKSNPSDLPENADELRIPVNFVKNN